MARRTGTVPPLSGGLSANEKKALVADWIILSQRPGASRDKIFAQLAAVYYINVATVRKIVEECSELRQGGLASV
jgi:hypothetical protein